ncbi:hypothetical protein [Arboricoccus pini]|nr:hypothetical protein [Arboricoccus pini]
MNFKAFGLDLAQAFGCKLGGDKERDRHMWTLLSGRHWNDRTFFEGNRQ